ncbi:prepilin peptidase [Erythrobacter sp. JK5]|uniref:A24 family peptidase n=1 Tax=Erythrobacter sp. JK5 TaxID=2829500 RepID=UPI001BA5A6D1|nr:prepilin peptidase [Erythrobacter sp. JK5]QUL38130.1 prepilin peptidase [Erythrobacter sp. JK5]
MNAIIAGVLCGLLVLAAWLDGRYRLLPNWLAVLILCCGVATIFTGSHAAPWWSHPGHAGIALVIGFALFARGWLGGGDAKTYAALALSFPMSQAFGLLAATSIAMLAIGTVWIAVSRIRRRRAAASGPTEAVGARGDFAKIPLGVAIAAGGIAMVVLRHT